MLNRSSFRIGGYNYKKLHSILESLPKDALVQISDEDLYCICLHVLSATMARTLKLFVQVDGSGEFLNVLVFMPIERLTPETHFAITKYLAAKFDTKIITDEITTISDNFCYLYVTLETKGSVPEFSLVDIERDLEHLSARWHLALMQELAKLDIDSSAQLENAFPKEYQYLFSPEEASEDYLFLCKLQGERDVLFNLKKIEHDESKIKVYSSSRIMLSDVLPLIENLGFKALTQRTFDINIGEKSKWLSEFIVSASYNSKDDFKDIKSNVEDALALMMSGKLEVDSICKLIVLEGLNWEKIFLLKAIVSYIAQTGISYGIDVTQSVLVKHHYFASMIIKFFEAKFSTKGSSTELIKSTSDEILSFLNKITNSVEDKILRSFFGILDAMNRTNYYQKKKEYLSFKFDSHKISWLPKPLPFAEIFVYSHDFEGVHLRGGRVARGGLRWSDRREDYRTEALGLMKAQMTKNSVIVPSGSKGAFFIKLDSTGLEKADYMKRVVECYKNFLRGLLDITDNVVNGNIVHPDECIIYDNADPYLVVAADKGTATFSDYANSVSAEYNFWLGDAFASGGSAGYDHKKMAITAKGAWISVRRHFAEMGVDVQKDNITVVGIGDMSGDVFGNGMLLSSAIKLVAAFNHKHIFIDPNPLPEVSFKERQRLFNLPTSGWSDYDPKLISRGGGVFERSAKFISLSSEAKELFDVENDEITPDQLISKILTAKVDLIWNGGIGTYIKASDESHLEIGDKSNDNLRCNGLDIRAKVIGEGGNLGCSQRGRIEYARSGGRINTDFIDNSAGVDCSDHEVNIKIAFEAAMKDSSVTLEKRNKMLKDMTDDVAKLVLADNENQTLALTLAEKSTAYNTGMFGHLMDYLENNSSLDRKVEFLPTNADINKRVTNKEPLTRPELAVIMSYSKMSLYQTLLTSKVADDEYVESFLFDYFPKTMQKDMSEYIRSHQLRKEIILTSITNKIVNKLGGPIINQIRMDTGAQLCDIVRAYIVTNYIFNIEKLWDEVTALENKINSHVQIDLFSELIKLLRRGISWFVRNLEQSVNIATAISIYGNSVEQTCSRLESFLLGHAKEKLQTKTAWYSEGVVPADLSYNISSLDYGISALDITTLSIANDVNIEDVAMLYFKIADMFSLDWLRKMSEKNMVDSYWNRLSVQALKDDIYDKQRRMINSIIEFNISNKNKKIDLSSWVNKHEKSIMAFSRLIAELKLQENIDLNMIILANKQFEILLRKI
ncbi:MAG: NAD-specific glutamate dehydrogenase [Pseudomonadota bacterium]